MQIRSQNRLEATNMRLKIIIMITINIHEVLPGLQVQAKADPVVPASKTNSHSRAHHPTPINCCARASLQSAQLFILGTVCTCLSAKRTAFYPRNCGEHRKRIT